MTPPSCPAEHPRADPDRDARFLRFDGVGKEFRTRSGLVEALRSVTLDVGRAEFLAVLGASGCGKSTLLLLAAGISWPTRGQILIEGVPVTGPHPHLGLVFQSPVLLDWYSTLGNVLLQIRARALPIDQYKTRAIELLGAVGLRGFEHVRPYELSGGMQARVALCRALIHDPELLLMDEPFGSLDALTRDQMTLDLQRLWLRSRPTVVFVTHSISEAVFLADRVVVLTPRQAEVDEVVPINLPRPRTLQVRDTEEFASYARHLRRILERQGVLSDTGGSAG